MGCAAMKFEIIAPGKPKDSFLTRGIVEYSKRLERYATLSITYVPDRKVRGSGEEFKDRESELLLAKISSNAYSVALDSGGKQYSSEGFAELISRWEMQNIRHVSFILGGPYGLSKKALQRVHTSISLSAMTFTHDMVRIFLLEQLYRAFTIKAGEKYHK